MKKKTVIWLLALLFALASVFAASYKAVCRDRAGFTTIYSPPQIAMSDDLLKIIAGEFKGLAADYLLLEIGSFAGSGQTALSQDWDNIHQALKKSLVLDPYFQQTYLLTQGNLPWAAKMPEKAIELLDISKKHRTWDWRPGYYMGFDYYYFLKDYEKASEVFLETSKIPGAPVLMTLLGARFAQKSRQEATAIHLLSTMLDDPNLDENSQKEIKNRIIALKGVLLLKQAIDAYQKKHRIFPDSLETLVAERIIDKLPTNPYGGGFTYENGQVEF